MVFGLRTGWNRNGLVAVMLAAVFSLALAGCGGSSSTTAETPVVDTSLTDAKKAAMAAHEAARKALDDVMAGMDADKDNYDAAAREVANAKAASDEAQAAETLEAAQLAQAAAERARTEAMKFTALVMTAHTDAQLKMAKDAAMKAYTDAKAALDAVMDNKAANMDAYDTAAEKVDAARAASDKAQAAETVDAAKAAQGEAEMAGAEAEKYTAMVTAAVPLKNAKDAAKAAYEAAKKALDDVMDNKDADMASYDAAAREVENAKAASDKAQGAETVEAAEVARDLAKTAQTEAEKYAGMVTTAHTAAQLADAKAAAMAAWEAARKALDEVMANKDADEDAYNNAVLQVAAARAASDKAAAATTVADAQAAQKDAETAQAEAEKYAGMVTAAKMTADEMAMRKAISDKANSTMKAAIDAAVIVPTEGTGENAKYGWIDQADKNPAPVIRVVGGTPGVGFNGDHKLKKAELPAVLGEVGGFHGELHVRTTENESRGETVRDKFYVFTNYTADDLDTDSTEDNGYTFGLWLKETEKDGVITYNNVQGYQDFQSEAQRLPRTTIDNVEGEATYTGPAVGAYLHKAVKTDGTLDVAAAGVFKADTSLTAKFGGDDIPTSKKFSVSGTISNFQLSGGQENAWSLKLEAEAVNTVDNRDATFRMFNNGTTAGGGAAGTWSGTFYDDKASEEARGADTKAIPGILTGIFTGHFLNGSVHGAFGAGKE